jgi:hypothetical protein
MFFLTCYLDQDPDSFSELDPDAQIAHSLKRLDPDPHQVNADPKHCCPHHKNPEMKRF